MSEFDKHWDTHCISSNCEEDEAKIHFEAGQQSRQAKIELLEVQLKGAEEMAKLILDHKNKMVDELQEQLRIEREQGTDYFTDFHNAIAQRDELQARVDRVVHILTYTNHASTPLCNELRDILKGNKDEN